MAGERQNYKSKSSTTATAPTDATRNPNGQLHTAASSAAAAAAPADAPTAADAQLWVRVESRSRPGRFYWTTTDGLRSQWPRPAARKIVPPPTVARILG